MTSVIRPLEPSDLSFIYATWLQSFKYSSDFAKNIDKDTYYTFHQKVIERMLERGAQVFLATDTNAPEVIYGYVVFEAPVVHYVYVKKAFRGLGIGTELLKKCQDFTIVTHLTKSCKKFLSKNPNIVYNPYAI